MLYLLLETNKLLLYGMPRVFYARAIVNGVMMLAGKTTKDRIGLINSIYDDFPNYKIKLTSMYDLKPTDWKALNG